MTMAKLFMSRKVPHTVRLIAPVVLAVACTSDVATSVQGGSPVRFMVSNALISPVTVSIDGTAYAILGTGQSTQLTASSKTQLLTWTSAKPAGPDGQPFPDDIGEVKVPISGINGALEISNVIADQTYITVRVVNLTTTKVALGVSDGTTVTCAGVLPGATSTSSGFWQIGYYRLLATTEVRAYRDGARCTGPYSSWPSSQLAAFAPKSGLLTLSLSSAP
jgi:hypothetical protein